MLLLLVMWPSVRLYEPKGFPWGKPIDRDNVTANHLGKGQGGQGDAAVIQALIENNGGMYSVKLRQTRDGELGFNVHDQASNKNIKFTIEVDAAAPQFNSSFLRAFDGDKKVASIWLNLIGPLQWKAIQFMREHPELIGPLHQKPEAAASGQK